MVSPAIKDLAQKLYNMDPNWEWQQGIQKFIPWDRLSAPVVESYYNSAMGLVQFVNIFERDIPLSNLNNIIKKLSPNRISIDTES